MGETTIDDVELKLSVPHVEMNRTSRALGLDILNASIRQVFFFDTRDLELFDQGLILRARRNQVGEHDTVVKIRPVVPSEIDAVWRRHPGHKIELDIMQGKEVCSASLKLPVPPTRISKTVTGERPIEKLFSKEQRAFLAQRDVPIPWDRIVTLGPVNVLKLKQAMPDFGHKVVAELWRYPDGTEMFELSMKCDPAETVQARHDARQYLTGLGLDFEPDGGTKTRSALSFFAAQLDQAGEHPDAT
jgi:hypothetical protein